MENENKEGKGKKSIVILIVALLLAIIIVLSIVLPLTLSKKGDKTKPEPKEATINLSADKSSGDGTFTKGKWFAKVGSGEAAEHTAEEEMTLKAKSGETVYVGLSYTLDYQYEGGAYIESLTSSDLLTVSYALSTVADPDTAKFTEAFMGATWQTWTAATTQTQDNYVLLKLVVGNLTKDETLAADLDFAVVDGEYPGKALTVSFTDPYNLFVENYYTLIDGVPTQYTFPNEYKHTINLHIKEGETIYLGIYGNFLDYCDLVWLRNLIVSEGLTITCGSEDAWWHYHAPSAEEFADDVEIISDWKTCDYCYVYDLFILKIVADSSISAEELSISWNWDAQYPEG